MWDAQNQYWYGYEWTKNLASGVGQPTLSSWLPGATTSSNYAQSSTDPNHRWYHEGSSSPFNATQSCAGLPNVNEMTWYADKGDPHWDGDELWSTMGHLYTGGIWFKKRSQISGFNATTAYDGTDWRTAGNYHSWTLSLTLPSAADAGKYFYLPALGHYSSGQLDDVSGRGHYWSSSASPGASTLAYYLTFSSSSVVVGNYGRSREDGCRVGGFE